jgi:hypothetical protein
MDNSKPETPLPPKYTEIATVLFPEKSPYAVQPVIEPVLDSLKVMATNFGISRLFKERMPNIYGKEFVFLFDDSGSMRNKDKGASINRWVELKEFARYAISMSSAFDDDGVDVYFLNRPKVEHVKRIEQLDLIFQREPTDYCLTPLSSMVDLILTEKREAFLKGNMILLIATDGEPRSQDGSDSVANFKRILKNRHTKIGAASLSLMPVSIRACTNDMNSIRYLNKLDADESLFLDVSDDYESEKNEIQKVVGRDFNFSYGDYILKCLIGSFDAWMDKLDEPKNLTYQEIQYQKFGEIPTGNNNAPQNNNASAPKNGNYKLKGFRGKTLKKCTIQ